MSVLPSKPRVARLLAFLDKTIGIAEIVIDAVENIEGRRPRAAANAHHEPRQHRRAAGHQPGACVLARSLVPMTKPASRVSESSAANGAISPTFEHGERRFHHGPDADARDGCPCRPAGPLSPAIALGVRYFRHQDGVRRGRLRRRRYPRPTSGVSSPLMRTSTSRSPKPGLERLDDIVACGGLGLRRHRIFQIENEPIGG